MNNQKAIILAFVWILGLSLTYSGSINAQDPVFNTFSEEDGLPSNDVYDVLVDREGFMWFATDNGVSRYDGNIFVNYNVSNGLPTNSILKLYEDQFGRIWFLAYNGMLTYYENGEVIQYEYNDTIVSYFHDNYFNRIYVDSTKGVLLSPRQGGYGYVDNSGNLNADDSMRPHGVDSCFLSFEDRGDEYFLSILSQKPGECMRTGRLFYLDSNYFIPVEFTPREWQRNFIDLGHGSYMVSFRNCVYYIKDHKIIASRYFREEILAIYHDDHNRIWISVKYNHGLFMFEDNDLEAEGTHFFSGFTITSITQDMEGDFWLGTEGYGVFFLPSFDFMLYRLPGDDRNLNVMALAISGDRIWFTSRNKHLYGGNIEKGKINNIRRIKIAEPYDWIKHISIDSKGYLWLSSTKHLRYDPAGFPVPLDTVLNSSFLVKGLGDTIIVASRRLGVYHHEKLLSLTDPDSSRRVYSAFHDSERGLWLGTLYGLYLFFNERSCFKGKISPFLQERISSIDKIGDLLVVGTTAYGLLILEDDTVKYHLTSDNGLIGNSIKSLFVQNDTIVWVGTKDGLNKISFFSDMNEYKLESYGQSDGLPSSEVNAISMHDNHIWLATGRGLVSFNPNDLRPHLTPPAIQINSIRINGKDTSLLKSYDLSYNQNNIRIIFSGLSYRSDEGLQYRYRMANYNSEIIETKNAWADFPNLPPGDYTFFVNVGNIHGVWNDAPVRIQFSIRKHFTQTLWFMILLILASVIIIVLVTFFFRRQKKIKEDAKNELARMEQKLFRLQMNPHFVFNALLAIQGFMYMNKTREAGRYLTSFAKLIRHTLYGSSEENISLDKELEALQYYLELQRLRFNDNFDFNIDLDDDIIPESTLIPPLLIQPFLENSIEHGLQHKKEKGMLKLKIEMQEGCLMVEVEDDGIGREKSRKLQEKKGRLHKSMGLEIIRKRVESLNKIMHSKIHLEITDLSDENGKASGTLVRICIPYKSAW